MNNADTKTSSALGHEDARNHTPGLNEPNGYESQRAYWRGYHHQLEAIRLFVLRMERIDRRAK